jgi:hypothetical protein
VDENEGSEEIYVGRPQERSEEAESDESEGPTADDVIKAWTSEDPAANSFKGIPLRCIPCKALILNRVTYLQHLQSKGHVKKVKSACDPKEVMQLASGSNEPQEEEETHGERLARIKSLAATAPLTEKPIDADSSDDEVKESKVEISGGKRDRKKEKRPGKRQRIELKAKGIDPSTKKKYKAKLKSAKAASS